MDSPVLIGIHGVKGVGKDTTAGFIKEWTMRPTASKPTPSVVCRGFADKAKWAYARQFLPTCTMAEGVAFVDKYKNDPTAYIRAHYTPTLEHATADPVMPEAIVPSIPFRLHMAQFSTESAREIYGEDHWVDQLLPLGYDNIWKSWPAWWGSFAVKVDENSYDVPEFCVVTDNRFANETERIGLLGLKVKIRRRDAELAVVEEARREGREIHLSEVGLPDEMFDVVINNDNNNMDDARRKTFQLMYEIESNGFASIRRGVPLPWVLR